MNSLTKSGDTGVIKSVKKSPAIVEPGTSTKDTYFCEGNIQAHQYETVKTSTHNLLIRVLEFFKSSQEKVMEHYITKLFYDKHYNFEDINDVLKSLLDLIDSTVSELNTFKSYIHGQVKDIDASREASVFLPKSLTSLDEDVLKSDEAEDSAPRIRVRSVCEINSLKIEDMTISSDEDSIVDDGPLFVVLDENDYKPENSKISNNLIGEVIIIDSSSEDDEVTSAKESGDTGVIKSVKKSPAIVEPGTSTKDTYFCEGNIQAHQDETVKTSTHSGDTGVIKSPEIVEPGTSTKDTYFCEGTKPQNYYWPIKTWIHVLLIQVVVFFDWMHIQVTTQNDVKLFDDEHCNLENFNDVLQSLLDLIDFTTSVLDAFQSYIIRFMHGKEEGIDDSSEPSEDDTPAFEPKSSLTRLDEDSLKPEKAEDSAPRIHVPENSQISKNLRRKDINIDSSCEDDEVTSSEEKRSWVLSKTKKALSECEKKKRKETIAKKKNKKNDFSSSDEETHKLCDLNNLKRSRNLSSGKSDDLKTKSEPECSKSSKIRKTEISLLDCKDSNSLVSDNSEHSEVDLRFNFLDNLKSMNNVSTNHAPIEDLSRMTTYGSDDGLDVLTDSSLDALVNILEANQGKVNRGTSK